MQYALEVSLVIKRGRNYFYTKCTVYFTEEERAIIRERNMWGYFLLFKRGCVNYPKLAGEDPYKIGPMILAFEGVVIAIILGINMNGWFVLLAFIAIWYVYKEQQAVLDANNSPIKETITLGEIYRDGSFSVCAFDDMFKSKAVEGELREQMERLKALLLISGEDTSTKWHSV